MEISKKSLSSFSFIKTFKKGTLYAIESRRLQANLKNRRFFRNGGQHFTGKS